MHVKFSCILAVAALASTEAVAGTPGASKAPYANELTTRGEPPCAQGLGARLEQPSTSPAHSRTLPVRSGLISYGDPPAFRLTSGMRPKPAGSRTVPVRSGLISYGDPPSPFAGFRPKVSMGGHGRVHHVTWYAANGTSLTLSVDTDVDLFDVDALIVPAGDWTDVEIGMRDPLLIEGEVEGAPLSLELDMASWSVALDQPVHSDGSALVVVDLSLPEDLVSEALDSDGLDVQPGDLQHDEIAAMLQDAMIGVAR